MSKQTSKKAAQKAQPAPQDPHAVSRRLDQQTAQDQPLDEAAHARNIGQHTGPGRPPLMKK